MAAVVASYQFRLLTLQDFTIVYDIRDMMKIIKVWRDGRYFQNQCLNCQRVFNFAVHNFYTCCGKFYLTNTPEYMVKSLAVRTPNVPFFSNYLKSKLLKYKMFAEYISQDFLVLPDPIYWQMETTLIYDLALKFLNDPYKYYHSHFEMSKLFLRLQNAPLMQCSLSHRTQGKNSLYRKIALAKRAEKTGRAMIVPAPFLKPNQVVLPLCMQMYKDLWVLVNRMPTLWPLSFVALKIHSFWDSDCVGIPPELAFALNSDYDGDEVNLHFIEQPSSQNECRYILNCENNMRSFCNQIKMSPSQDAVVAYYLCPLPIRDKYPSLSQLLQLIFEVEGSKSCFEYCDLFRRYYLYMLEHEVSFSVSFQEFLDLEKIARKTKSYDNFEHFLENTPHEEKCLEIQVKSGSKGSLYHLYQLVGSVGPQKQTLGNFVTIQSSFMKGMTAQEYLLHAMSGHDALIESSVGVWRPGYVYFKIVNSTQNIIVTYCGKLVNGNYVISKDALSQVHPTEIISNVTFDYIFDMYFS